MNGLYFNPSPCTTDELKESMRLSIWKTGRKRRIIRGIGFVLVLIIAAVLWVIAPAAEARGLCLFAVILGVVYAIITPIAVNTGVKKNAAKLRESQTTVSEDGVTTVCPAVKSDFTWQAFGETDEGEGVFVLNTTKYGVIPVPKARLCAMIPNEIAPAPGEHVDVVAMFRDFVAAKTGRAVKKVKVKKDVFPVIAAIIAAALLIATFLVSTTGLVMRRTYGEGYSIMLPVNVEWGIPEEGGTFSVWNEDFDAYNYLDDAQGVMGYFGGTLSAAEYLDEVFAGESAGAVDVRRTTLENGTAVISCTYPDDDCFYLRAVTMSSDGYWTTNFIGYASERETMEPKFLAWLGTIEVR